jgi:hypothetical protein
MEYKTWDPNTNKTGSTTSKERTPPEFRNTPTTTNLEEEEIVDAPGNDDASMPEQVKRPNAWRRRRKKRRKKKMMMMIIGNIYVLIRRLIYYFFTSCNYSVGSEYWPLSRENPPLRQICGAASNRLWRRLCHVQEMNLKPSLAYRQAIRYFKGPYLIGPSFCLYTAHLR